jgi:hypothetical protein
MRRREFLGTIPVVFTTVGDPLGAGTIHPYRAGGRHAATRVSWCSRRRDGDVASCGASVVGNAGSRNIERRVGGAMGGPHDRISPGLGRDGLQI